MAKILSLHGYLSSHNVGFEKVAYGSFSREHDFKRLELLGHEGGRVKRLYPIYDIILDAVSKIEGELEDGVILMGKSFGAYPVLDVASRRSEIAGVVLMKPMMDVKYTISKEHLLIRKYWNEINPEEAIEKCVFGTVENPFELGGTPVLTFNGDDDYFAGDCRVARNKIKGNNVSCSRIKGMHNDFVEESSEKVIREVGSFLDSL